VIVLDASVLIAFLASDDPHHSTADRLLLDAIESGTSLAVNTVTLAECLVLPTRQDRVAMTVEKLVALGVVEVAFPAGAAERMAQLRVDTGLKLPDCIVLLTALDQRGALATFDDRLRRAALDEGVPVQPR
jgi:predicted nucleic acid-binding protein